MKDSDLDRELSVDKHGQMVWCAYYHGCVGIGVQTQNCTSKIHPPSSTITTNLNADMR